MQLESLEKDITFLDERVNRLEDNNRLKDKVIISEIKTLKNSILEMQITLNKLIDYSKSLDNYLRSIEVKQ